MSPIVLPPMSELDFWQHLAGERRGEFVFKTKFDHAYGRRRGRELLFLATSVFRRT